VARDPIPTHAFALVVVRLGRRFLVVKERKHGQRWYLPAGRVEPGETLADAARRETLEESGVPIELEGLVRVEHSPGASANRLRAIFVARPADDTPPKSAPDDETLEARFVTLEELAELDTRGEEVEALFRFVADGGPVYPLTALTWEGAPLT
jgi:phosphatase NudJ